MVDDNEIRVVTKEEERLQAFPIIAERGDKLTRESSPEYVEERRSGSFE